MCFWLICGLTWLIYKEDQTGSGDRSVQCAARHRNSSSSLSTTPTPHGYWRRQQKYFDISLYRLECNAETVGGGINHSRLFFLISGRNFCVKKWPIHMAPPKKPSSSFRGRSCHVEDTCRPPNPVLGGRLAASKTFFGTFLSLFIFDIIPFNPFDRHETIGREPTKQRKYFKNSAKNLKKKSINTCV